MKDNKKNGLIMLFIFWIVFVLVYTYRLTRFPIFEDEAIHLLMAERLFNSPFNNFFIYMSHNFLPGFGWLFFPIRFFIKDSLLAGRLLNVFLASSIFFWLYLIKDTFKFPARFFILSSSLILFSPILFLNSRIALLDTAVMVFSLWSLYLFLLVINKPKPFYLVLFFFVLLTCLLIKFTSLFILPSLIFIFLLNYRKTKSLAKYKYSLITLFFALAAFLLIVSPFFFQVSDILKTGSVFVLKTGDILTRVHQNFWLFLNWSNVYYPLFPLSVLSFAVLILTKKKVRGSELMTALLIWFITSLFVMICFNRFFYPRHILMLLMPFLIIPIFVLLKYPAKVSVFFVAFLVFMRIILLKDLVLDDTFAKAQIAKEDRFQYFEDYTSGINIDSLASFISKKAANYANGKITVWLDGSWVMEYGLRRALKDIPNIEFKSFVDFESHRYAISGKILKDENKLNYVVVNKNRPLNIKDLVLEKEFNWGGYHPEYLYVFNE